MIRDKILIEQLEGVKEIAGLQMAQNHIQKIKAGKVLSCNTEYRYPNGDLEQIKCKAGDIVHYSDFAGSKVEIDNKPYLVIKYDDIHYIHS